MLSIMNNFLEYWKFILNLYKKYFRSLFTNLAQQYVPQKQSKDCFFLMYDVETLLLYYLGGLVVTFWCTIWVNSSLINLVASVIQFFAQQALWLQSQASKQLLPSLETADQQCNLQMHLPLLLRSLPAWLPHQKFRMRCWHRGHQFEWSLSRSQHLIWL